MGQKKEDQIKHFDQGSHLIQQYVCMGRHAWALQLVNRSSADVQVQQPVSLWLKRSTQSGPGQLLLYPLRCVSYNFHTSIPKYNQDCMQKINIKVLCRKIHFGWLIKTEVTTITTTIRMVKIIEKMDQKKEDQIKHFAWGSRLDSARLPCNRLCVWGDMHEQLHCCRQEFITGRMCNSHMVSIPIWTGWGRQSAVNMLTRYLTWSHSSC